MKIVIAVDGGAVQTVNFTEQDEPALRVVVLDFDVGGGSDEVTTLITGGDYKGQRVFISEMIPGPWIDLDDEVRRLIEALLAR